MTIQQCIETILALIIVIVGMYAVTLLLFITV